jgi:hypothetical protein
MWISVLRRLHPKRRSIGRRGGWRRRGSPPPAFRAWYLAVEARRNDHAPGWARQFLGLDVSLAPLARLAQNEELGCTGSDTGGRGRLGPMMSSINDVAKLYDEFEEAFVDVMTAKSEGLSFSRRMKLRLARSRLRAHKDFTQREYEAAVLRADARSWKILG